MKLLVIGAGYVGLVTATCFAEVGYHTVCLDIDSQKIQKLNQGQIPIYEMGLQEMVLRNLHDKRLNFTTDYAEGLKEANLCFICVDTPSDAQGACDLSRVRQVIQSMAEHMSKPLVVVMKSTAPVGTCDMVKRLLREKLNSLGKEHLSFEIASNPEFLKEGCAIADFMKPDRVVIGVETLATGQVLCDLYSPFNLNHERMIVVDPKSSEMIKYASNAMLATRISFMNELAGLCERVGADVSKVRKGLGSDSRISNAFLYAGVGFGGSCFPKDIRALRALARSYAYPTTVLDSVDAVNRRQKYVLSQKVFQYFGPEAKPIVAVWGLAFKPDTDDMREAPSLVFIQQLWEKGYILRLYDPVAMPNAKKALQELGITGERIQWCSSEYEAASGSNAIALVTEWKQFRQVDFEALYSQMHTHVVFDGRNQYRQEELIKLGFDHVTIGRKNHFAEHNHALRHEEAMLIPPLMDFEEI
jgi:UDPglucose 6-dehydrogenase